VLSSYATSEYSICFAWMLQWLNEQKLVQQLIKLIDASETPEVGSFNISLLLTSLYDCVSSNGHAKLEDYCQCIKYCSGVNPGGWGS